MATWLKQSTAVDIGLGPFVDSVDGVTPETGLTLSQADIRLKKNGANWAQKNQSSSATHEENGWYEISLDATDTNTLGILLIAVNESGTLPVWREFVVVPANVYDSLAAGSASLNVAAASIASDAITAAALATDAVTEIQSGLSTLTAAGVRTAVGLASANLDTQLDALPTANENADALLDRTAGVETNRTVRQALRFMLAAMVGKLSGAATTTVTIRDTNDGVNRIVATVDSDGNRSAVTLDGS